METKENKWVVSVGEIEAVVSYTNLVLGQSEPLTRVARVKHSLAHNPFQSATSNTFTLNRELV